MKRIITEEGVAAKFEGKYWGLKRIGGQTSDFVDFENARVSNPEFCKKPTDLTFDPIASNLYNPDYKKLEKATLVKVIRTTTIEFEEL